MIYKTNFKNNITSVRYFLLLLLPLQIAAASFKQFYRKKENLPNQYDYKGKSYSTTHIKVKINCDVFETT